MNNRNISEEIYAKIPKKPADGEFYQLFPGCYCANCGDTFAMYSYGIQPSSLDENGKAYFKYCGISKECKEIKAKKVAKIADENWSI